MKTILKGDSTQINTEVLIYDYVFHSLMKYYNLIVENQKINVKIIRTNVKRISLILSNQIILSRNLKLF